MSSKVFLSGNYNAKKNVAAKEIWSKEFKNLFSWSQKSKPGITQRNLPPPGVEVGPMAGLG